ncbi:S8/S53 family peptidase [Tissierella sp. MSJ-40]|uniref:S8/S53 family peptidase n=2 Tax=Tissierella simiarum TaxID=2841534 RepID=A0ABS6E5I4_9FIRM|nr:S8/S53 family peptidase [Tissierella simiarum]
MKKMILALVLILSLVMTSCSPKVSETNETFKSEVKIDRYPKAPNLDKGKIDALPSYNKNSESGWQVDLRGCDLSDLDVRDRMEDLLRADFDTRTIWTKKLPKGYDPDKIMKFGKKPGLKIEKLHKKGITGEGIGIAIIDMPLLVDHIEYKDNLKLYEEINWPYDEAELHGPAVASIAVGKTVGVAPGADLYYIAAPSGDDKDSGFQYNFKWMAQAIDRILEINKSLPEDRKIRVISMSIGWLKENEGYEEITSSVEEAKKQGIFVVSTVLDETYGYSFHGLGRDPLKNPDEFSSYEPGSWWIDNFYGMPDNYLLVPMDSRTMARQTGKEDYGFYRQGGLSWAVPYIAGLYALCCQVEPDITPDVFWEKALETGETITFEKGDNKYELGKIASPLELIRSLQSGN